MVESFVKEVLPFLSYNLKRSFAFLVPLARLLELLLCIAELLFDVPQSLSSMHIWCHLFEGRTQVVDLLSEFCFYCFRIFITQVILQLRKLRCNAVI